MKKPKLLLITLLLMIMIPTGIILAQSESSQPGQIVPTPTPYQLPTPLPEISSYDQTAKFSFADLDEESFVMRYPSFKDVYVPLPNEWALVGGEGNSYIEIHYDYFESTQDETVVPTPHPLFERYPFIARPGVEVYINDLLVSMFIPEFGKDNVVQIPIPSSVILPSGENPFNEYIIRLGFYSDADIYCNYDGVLTIYDDSFINAKFTTYPPFRTLANLPRPLVSDSFLPETLKLVIPDQPSTSDLQAIAILTSSIAQNAFSNEAYEVLRASEISDGDLAKSNAIIIGTPAENAFLASLYQKQLLPTTLSGNEILRSGSEVGASDGVLQMIPSDVNQYYTFVTVTGESAEGVLRAANAFKQLPIGTPPFALIVTDDMVPPAMESEEAPLLQTKFTYADLGYVDRTRFGLGLQRFFLRFYVPRDWVLDEDPVLTINYAYSDAIEAQSSNAVIILNGEPIGNLVLQDSPARQQTVEVQLRKDLILKGMVNVVEFQATLAATLVCEDYNPDVYWFNVADDSTLDLPYRIAASATEISGVINPAVPFAFEPKHLVILGSNPTKTQLDTFANLYRQFGELNSFGNYDVIISLEDNVNLAEYPDRNILMIGLPTSSDVVDQINERLPQPFVTGTDNLQQNIANNAYQLVPGVSIGVVEGIPAEWDHARTIALISGTSDEGLEWATRQMLSNPSAFMGDLFFIQDRTVTSFTSTLFSRPVLDSLVSEALQEEQLTPVEEATTEEGEQPTIGEAGQFVRDEKINTSTTPMFLMGVIGIVGLVFIIYLASRIASGGRKS
ncbi:MAG: cellulose biosynthesis cyclic di-GMP-binding regulatory protein BcsB [Anaerolineae bacterium]|nr:cellulose biosynthesis cyclic di-GMP-binding regulatory protein BcsB [Anaerolineae bacterium]